MKGKKLQRLLFLAIITMLFLYGCSQVEGPAAVEEVVESEPVAEEQEGEPAEEEVEEEIFAAFAHVGPVSDEGWTWAHDQGRMALEEAFPNVRTAMVENMPFSGEASRTLQQFVDDGADMVFITSEYADFTYEVADANPGVVFLETNGHRSTDNSISYYLEHWDAAFLVGMAAGLLTESDQLGYIGSFPIDTIYSNVNAFHMGARSVNPDVTTKVVLINSWFDPAAANQAANTLIDDGADFLFGIMDEAAYLEVAEERGVWAAMWNTDMRRFGPNAYVTSIIIDFEDYYISEVQAFLDGTWEGGRTVLLPLGEGVDRDEWGQNVPQDVREQVDTVRQRILEEGYNPFVGPIHDAEGSLRVEEGEELSDEYLYSQWIWPVEGVVGLESQ